MALSLVTAPTNEPLTLDEAKKQARIDWDDENELVVGWITAARQYAELFTGRALLPQTWDLKLDAFPCSTEPLWLPKPPVTAVSSITYLDTAGVSQTWSSSLYLTDLPSGPNAARARVTPTWAQYYPYTYGVMNAVTVRFVAGYADAESVPAPIRSAIAILVAHWAGVGRVPVVIDRGNALSIPLTVDALLWPYKVF